MAPCLWKDSLRGIHKNHGKVRRGRTGSHIARVLLVSRRVRDNEFSPWRREITVSHIDGDTVRAFHPQAIPHQVEVDRPSGTVDAPLFQWGLLVFVHRLGAV